MLAKVDHSPVVNLAFEQPFDLTLNAQISDTLLRRYVVERVSAPPGLPANVDACLRRAIGSTINLAASGVPPEALQSQLREVVVFPLPAVG